MSPRTARKSPSGNFQVVPLFPDRSDMLFAELSDMLRRERRARGWTQRELADLCKVRTQTVSAWERGHAPQQRFFGIIADFLGLDGKEAVEAVLSGNHANVTPTSGGTRDPSSGRTDKQDRVLDVVLSLLERQSEPSQELMGIIHDLMASVGLSGNALPGARDNHRPDR
jgi:transcriptional regulator with XRE-family HTH domain